VILAYRYAHTRLQGAGTYGIVYSMTVKAHPDAKVAFASLSFARTTNEDQYLAAVEAHLSGLKRFIDAGIYVNTIWFPNLFVVPLIVWYNHTQEELDALTSPHLQSLRDTGVDVAYQSTLYPTYLDMYNDQPSVQNSEIGGFLFGGRIIPKALFNTEDGFQSFLEFVTTQIRNGDSAAYITMPSTKEYPDNAVLPAWRDSAGFVITLV